MCHNFYFLCGYIFPDECSLYTVYFLCLFHSFVVAFLFISFNICVMFILVPFWLNKQAVDIFLDQLFGRPSGGKGTERPTQG